MNTNLYQNNSSYQKRTEETQYPQVNSGNNQPTRTFQYF